MADHNIINLNIPCNENVSIPDRDYILRDGAAWFSLNGMTIRIRQDGTGLIIKIWEGDSVFREPIYEASVDPQWKDSEDGPSPLAAWYDTSKELE